MQLISGQLYQYLQSVQAYIAPPITAVFLVGLFSSRINARGAMAALYTGFVLGLGRLVLELNKSRLDGVMFTFANINFLHFAALLFVLCTLVLVVVSLTAPPPAPEQIAGLTYQTTARAAVRRTGVTLDVVLSAIVAAIIAAQWLYFSR
jgi:SSS family solute:Na+ symporter